MAIFTSRMKKWLLVIAGLISFRALLLLLNTSSNLSSSSSSSSSTVKVYGHSKEGSSSFDMLKKGIDIVSNDALHVTFENTPFRLSFEPEQSEMSAVTQETLAEDNYTLLRDKFTSGDLTEMGKDYFIRSNAGSELSCYDSSFFNHHRQCSLYRSRYAVLRNSSISHSRDGNVLVGYEKRFLRENKTPISDKFDEVVALIGNGNSGKGNDDEKNESWDFVGEMLPSLEVLRTGDDLSQKDFFVYVTRKSEFILSWLKLLGISEDRVISGAILANKLIVPEVGRGGATVSSHVDWMRNQTMKALPAPVVSHSNVDTRKRNILLLHQPNSEIEEQIKNIVKTASSDYDWNIVHYDTSSASMSLPEKLSLFRDASVIISYQSIDMVNLFACRPGTHIIEFGPTSDWTFRYARLSYLLLLHYNGIVRNSNTFNSDIFREAWNNARIVDPK